MPAAAIPGGRPTPCRATRGIEDPARHARRLKHRGEKFHPLQPRTRGVKFGRKPKLTRQQIHHARKLIDDGQRREDVAALLNVNRTTLYRALTA